MTDDRTNSSYPVPPVYLQALLNYYDASKDGSLIGWLRENVSAHLRALDLSQSQPVLDLDATGTITLSVADQGLLRGICKDYNLTRRQGLRFVYGQFITNGPRVSAKETV